MGVWNERVKTMGDKSSIVLTINKSTIKNVLKKSQLNSETNYLDFYIIGILYNQNILAGIIYY